MRLSKKRRNFASRIVKKMVRLIEKKYFILKKKNSPIRKRRWKYWPEVASYFTRGVLPKSGRLKSNIK
jgi:hypothetical protein